ncbi:MAG: DsbA family oxidoreductase [Rhizobiales bacterium]|nr:DsbA family oxidoreductase [Hyphomicrobiales bacterium]
MENKAPLVIDVVSDVVCPWCYLGKRRLERAIALVPATDIVVRWHPFQLDPTIPPGGLDRTEYMKAKFGDLSRVDAIHDRLIAFGKEEGVDYRFDAIKRAPNTLDAHRLVHWAPVDRQDALVEALFRANFTEGRDVGDPAVLAEIGSQHGLDREATLARLATDEDLGAIRGAIAEAQRIGVTGVPCFIVGGRYAVMGAEQPQVIASAIEKAASEAAA